MKSICQRGLVTLISFLPFAGCHRVLDSRDVSSRSKAMLLLDEAREVQYYRNYENTGRIEAEGVSYVVDAEYPAESVICRVTEHLASTGWRPLSRSHDDAGTASSYLKGWRVIINRRDRPDEAHVDLWDAEWVNGDGDLLSYSLTYRYPTRGPRNSSQMRIGAIWTPNRLAERLGGGRAVGNEQVPQGETPRITPELVARCGGGARR